MGLLAACSGTGEDSSSNDSAIGTAGRWALPSDVLLAGAKVRLTYDDAPTWTTTKACGGKLRPGGKVLGEYLIDHFAIITSVGGYACRRNTADLKRMSVHGTGRALDVFIPRIGGQADNTQGDKVANWLVRNAQNIGVQLIIWDRSIWRANGTNDAPYGGPVPHTDHIHVELTEEAAVHTKQWFPGDDGGMGDAGSGADGATTDDTADSGTDETDTDDDASTPPAPDAAPPPAKDAGTKDAAPPVDAPDAAPSTTPDTSTEPAPPGDPSSGIPSAGDEPGETNSIPERPTRHAPSVEDDPPSASNSGCSAAPGSQHPMHSLGSGLALMLGLGAWLRRRRR